MSLGIACGASEDSDSDQPELPAEYGCPEPFSPDRVYAVASGPEDPDVWTAWDVDDPAWTCTFAAARGAAELQVRPSDGALVGAAHEDAEQPGLQRPPATQIWRIVAPEALVWGSTLDPSEPAAQNDWFIGTWPEDGDELLGMPCGPDGYVDRTLVGADGTAVFAYCVDPSDSWEVRDVEGNVVYDLGDEDAQPLSFLADGRLLVAYDETDLALLDPASGPAPITGEDLPNEVIAVRRVDDDVLVAAYGPLDAVPPVLLWRIHEGVISHEGTYDHVTFDARGDHDLRWALDPQGALVGYFEVDPERPQQGYSAIVRLRPDGTWNTIGSGADLFELVTGAYLLP